MFAIPVTKESHPVSVLLGGSGRARMPISIMPALLRPLPAIPGWLGSASEYRAAGV